MIRVILPYHLRTLAQVGAEVALDVAAPVTARAILDALEARYPMLCGTIRDHVTKERRPLVRFWACNEDVSHDSVDSPLPAAIASGGEPFFVVGAIAGGQEIPKETNHVICVTRNQKETSPMRKFLTLTMAIAMLAAAPLTAQPPTVKPGPEHEMLKENDGIWDATAKSMAGESKGTLHCKMALNGLWMLEHFEGEFGGVKFEGRGATSYDPTKKKFVNAWIDSMITSPRLSEGTYDKAKKTLTFLGDMPMPDGKSMKLTTTIVYTDANNKTFTLKGNADGKELEMVEITYKRRAK